jgi:hypothetical protein
MSRSIAFICLMAIFSAVLLKCSYEIGFRGGFIWGFRSVPSVSQDVPATEI